MACGRLLDLVQPEPDPHDMPSAILDMIEPEIASFDPPMLHMIANEIYKMYLAR